MRLENEKSKNTFVYAITGIKKALKTEKNLRFDVFSGIVIIVCGFLFKISTTEWLICILSIGLMLFAEIMNTAIEAAVDLCTREKNELAAMAKDVSAGAVLVMAINVAIVGAIIFIPKIVKILNLG